METFSLVLLPCEKDMKLLDSLKLKFNREGFRHRISNTATHSHITLAQGKYLGENDIIKIKNELLPLVSTNSQVTAAVTSITKERRKSSEKIGYVNYWIALTFSDPKIVDFSTKLEKYLQEKSISTTHEYIEKVRSGDKNSQTKNIVGDHLNLCNYCKEERSAEAYELVKNTVPQKICFDKIGFRYKNGVLAWTILLLQNSNKL